MADRTDNTRTMYSEYRFGTFSYGDKREAYESLLFELLPKAKPDSILFDVGCGSGYWLDVYVRLGIRKDCINCIDLAPANVEAARARGFNATVGNVMDLVNIPDKVSDLTVSIGVIHCARDPFRAFRELVRITKPGGLIYLNLYNKYHPYYYIVHRATFPIRFLYWNWNRKVADVAYWCAKPVFQPLTYLALGEFLDDKTGKTMFMDQVITPIAHLYSKSMFNSYAARCGCTVQAFRYNRYKLMLAAVIRVNEDASGRSQ